MISPEQFLAEWCSASPLVAVHTSGSTGTPKTIMAEKSRMRASALRTCSWLRLRKGAAALLCLPADYIAGKMMIVRAEEWPLKLVSVPPSSHPLARASVVPPALAAMVPLQVASSLDVPAEAQLLGRIGHLLIGGGAVSPALERRLQDLPCKAWSTYGMTETLSNIALRPLNAAAKAHCQGDSTWYEPLPGVDVSLTADGCLAIDDPLTCPQRLFTHDRATLAPDGRRFRITGRSDLVICSGGLKIQTEEVERTLEEVLPVKFQITRADDAALGQTVVLLYQSGPAAPTPETLLALCRRALPRHWAPRRAIPVNRLPETPNGKPDRSAARALARES